MKKYLNNITKMLLLLPLLTALSCGDFLDVVPGETGDIDDAFITKNRAEGFLVGLFSYLPNHGSPTANPALTAGDEVWFNELNAGVGNLGFDPQVWKQVCRLGANTTGSPVCSYFSSRASQIATGVGTNGGDHLYTALRDINVFLEYMNTPEKRPYDLNDSDRKWWVANALFLKAYYHFWLFRLYGPIPIIRENLPITTLAQEAQVPRDGVDECINYIVELLDQAYPGLPLTLEKPPSGVSLTPATHLGMPTGLAAKALQAIVLTYAASPLYNCNDWFAEGQEGYIGTDSEGNNLFPQGGVAEYQAKWQRAADSLRVAIQLCHNEGAMLYRYGEPLTGSSQASISGYPAEIVSEMHLRGAVTDNSVKNKELIWGDSRSALLVQQNCRPSLQNDVGGFGNGLFMGWAPTLDIVEQYYTKNGVPITEDNDPFWVGHTDNTVAGNTHEAGATLSGLYELVEIPATGEYDAVMMRGNSVSTRSTARLHFDREPRFYGAISFERGRYFGRSEQPLNYWRPTENVEGDAVNTTNESKDDDYTTVMAWKSMFKKSHTTIQSATGYLCKKLIAYNSTVGTRDGSGGLQAYFFPIIRLADLYLLYAEALNEVQDAPQGNSDAVGDDYDSPFPWINKVRVRSSIPTVGTAWRDHTDRGASAYDNKDGLRAIIQQERLIEFAFEGQRFYDLRRWKRAEEFLAKDVRGLNVSATNAESIRPDAFYDVTVIREAKYRMAAGRQTYFWPIALDLQLQNPFLTQAPYYPK